MQRCTAIVLCSLISILALVCIESKGESSQERAHINREEIRRSLEASRTIASARFAGRELIQALLDVRTRGVDVGDVILENCVIEGDVELWQVGSHRSLTSAEAERCSLPAGIQVIEFPFRIHFRHSTLAEIEGSDEIGDCYVLYPHGIRLEGCVLFSASFDQCVFFDDVSFQSSEAEWVSFKSCNFSGWVDCSQMTVREAYFDQTAFLSFADFWRATFEDWGSFRETIFHEGAELGNAVFNGRADFVSACFDREVSLEGLEFRRGANLDDVKFARQEDLLPALLASLKGWEQTGNKGKADRYFYEYMVARRKQKPMAVQALELVLVDWTCAYGTSWERILATWWAIILVSTIIVWIGKGIEHSSEGRVVRSFWLSLYFSIVTFTTLGYGDYRPRRGYKVIADATAMIGAFMIALLAVVFARQFMR